MKNIKKAAALGLSAVMTISLLACGGNGGAGASASQNSAVSTKGQEREIVIGSWWRQYYDSTDENMEVNIDWVNAQDKDGDDEARLAENEVNRRVAQAKWDRVALLKEEYNWDFHWENLTYEGTKESLNTSTLAGAPDCDIYMVDAAMAIPAQGNGYLVDFREILPADHDLFTNQTVFSFLDIGDGKACILKVNEGMSNTFPLAFNKQLLEANNLEDPNELYARGEWTWDKFLEYCQILTQDTDGDGQIDQYGFCGYADDTLSELLMSNGAVIAGGSEQTLTSKPVEECLDMLQKLYSSTYSYPYDFTKDGGSPSDTMRIQYMQGNVGFFPTAVWIQDAQGNYSEDTDNNLTWDTVYVHWPVGPSGDAATNAASNAAEGNFFVIPVGVEDPVEVFNFLYDLYNWYDGDTSFRDDPATVNWWYNETAKDEQLKEDNFRIQKECLNAPGFELWNSVGVSYDLESLIAGDMTPAQFQETFKQQYQDALDQYFGN